MKRIFFRECAISRLRFSETNKGKIFISLSSPVLFASTSQIMAYKLRTCEKEYENNPKINESVIKQILVWAEKQPHMPKISGNY